jgi:hypothetical protein
MKNYIPKNKGDGEASNYLKGIPIEIVREDVSELLTWLQDMHWDAAQGIADYFVPYVNEIKTELIEILNGTDAEWKFNVMACIIEKSNKKLDPILITVLKRIAERPLLQDKNEELDILANKIISGNV